MKNIFVITLVSIFSVTTFMSCSSDDDSNSNNNPSTSEVEQSITEGTWRVSNFVEDDTNQTSNYSGFEFTFGDNGSLTASNGSTVKNGAWSTGTDDSTPKLIISFPDTDGPFDEISEDWRILNSSGSNISLEHLSGGDGSLDQLTFTKI